VGVRCFACSPRCARCAASWGAPDSPTSRVYTLACQWRGSVGQVPTLTQVFWAGVGSGFVNSFISCPFELAKICMQNQGTGTGTPSP
jgi:hypothetical protein